MKSVVLYILLVNSVLLHGQSSKEILLKTFDDYSTCLEQKQYEVAFDYYLDSFLLYIPKAKLIQQLAKYKDSDKVQYQLHVSPIEFISEPVVDALGKQYYGIKYTNSYEYVFSDSADTAFVQSLTQSYQKANEQSFVYSVEEKKFNFSKSRKTIAVVDSGVCSFIVYKEKLAPYMHLWMPQEAFDKIEHMMDKK